jgi:SAM-dependent methyltransferase
MPIKYENIMPWGRSYIEYIRMLNLTDKDLCRKILACGDGPASFNARMKKIGYKVTSLDPIYQFTKEQIDNRIQEVYDDVINQTKNNKEKFIWNSIHSIEELGSIRMSAMKEFIDDYNSGKTEGRYISGELPVLPFENKSFDLILCAHFLFFYSDNLSLDFHINSVREMCRIGKEIRIFPIVDLNGNSSPYLKPAKDFMTSIGWSVEEVKVSYEFQKNGNTMLKLIEQKI